ncbi:glycosyltransferase family 2 protein [Roseomonas sp. BN140053]|uniref:glycosyltransferase family 2 protein n=1 Tax=Roseomonas sp. BN140053 TaxID=3391898 RepID=UPI0039E7CAD6
MIPEKSPKVSVVIPAYRTAGTLARAVQSVLRGSEQDFEIIIVEDCSGDDTLAVAEDLAGLDPRIRVIAQPVNGGQSVARNAGIAAAQGRWIATLDADDRYQPERLQVLLEAGEREGVDMVADNQNHIDEAAGVIVLTAFPTTAPDRVVTLRDFMASADTSAEFSFGILKPVIRASFIREHDLSYQPGLKLGEDFYHLLQFFAAGGKGYLVSRPLYDWTLPFGPLSRTWTTTGDGAWRYNYRGTIEANAYFLKQVEENGQFELAALLKRREREYQVMIHYIDAQKTYAETGRRLAAAGIILRHPSTWPLLLRRITGRLRRRMAR